MQEPNSTLGTVLAVLAAAGPHARATAADGLTLSVYANTAGAAPAAETSVVTLGPVTVTPPSAAAAPFSAELTGTLYLAPAVQPHSGANLTFVCDFGGAVVGYLHIDDHLVCSTGVNSEPPSVLVLDQPLAVLTRTMLPVRMFVSYNGSSLVAKLAFNVTPGCTQPPTATKAAASNNNINININNSQHTPCPTSWFTLSPTLPANEVQRRAMQTELASGWGAWYQMDFLKQVLLPEGACVTLQLCDLHAKTCTGPAFSGGKVYPGTGARQN